jgi:hypothetical protein
MPENPENQFIIHPAYKLRPVNQAPAAGMPGKSHSLLFKTVVIYIASIRFNISNRMLPIPCHNTTTEIKEGKR